jgi:hypothetical protein
MAKYWVKKNENGLNVLKNAFFKFNGKSVPSDNRTLDCTCLDNFGGLTVEKGIH